MRRFGLIMRILQLPATCGNTAPQTTNQKVAGSSPAERAPKIPANRGVLLFLELLFVRAYHFSRTTAPRDIRDACSRLTPTNAWSANGQRFAASICFVVEAVLGATRRTRQRRRSRTAGRDLAGCKPLAARRRARDGRSRATRQRLREGTRSGTGERRRKRGPVLTPVLFSLVKGDGQPLEP